MSLSEAAATDRVRMRLTCEIVRWVADDPQPGIVEARVIDADGPHWSFLDKVAIFDMAGTVGPESNYPQPGLIRCEALDDAGDAAPTEMFVTTLRPDAVEAKHGQSTFHVNLTDLFWSDDHAGTAEPDALATEDHLVGARLLKLIAAWHVFDGVRSPTPVDVWLILDPVGLVRLDVASG